MKHILLALPLLSIPIQASNTPPSIPSGTINYESYAADSKVSISAPMAANSEQFPSNYLSPIESSSHDTTLNFNVFSSNYNVRGMGVVNGLSNYGFSSVDYNHTFENKNLFQAGLHQRINAGYGVIWGAGDKLAQRPLIELGYQIGKEIFPNLIAEFGYGLNYGGLEGFMSKSRGKSAHSITQNLQFQLKFDDQQEGPFGKFLLGYGVQGLTGWFSDISGGYRFSDVTNSNHGGMDLEIEAGISSSFGYWVGSVTGIDAYRVRATLRPYSHSGSYGRDSKFQISPWIEFAISGSSQDKIKRHYGGIIDKSQISVGLDCGWKF